VSSSSISVIARANLRTSAVVCPLSSPSSMKARCNCSCGVRRASGYVTASPGSCRVPSPRTLSQPSCRPARTTPT
jgi:hypothetical protein